MMVDNFRTRMLAITEQLQAQGVSPFTSAPPVYRLAWSVGLRIRPPLYQSFAALALQMGVLFTVLWGIIQWYVFDQPRSHSVPLAVVISGLAGVSFGLFMAWHYRAKASKLNLPPLDSQI